MANELKAFALTPAATYYAVVVSAAGTYWNGAAFVAFVAGNWATYAVGAAAANAAGDWLADFPAVAAGVYPVALRLRSGGSPAVTDAGAGVGVMEWDGTAELTLRNVDVGYVNHLPANPATARTVALTQRSVTVVDN